jgi:putative addiction module component (TIGR02574 family)
MTTTEIFDSAMTMPQRDRAHLAEQLLSSLDAPGNPEEIERAWEAEIARRVGEIDSGEVQCRAWEDARARLEAKYCGKA